MAGAAAWGWRRATAAGLQRLSGVAAESSPRLARRRPMGVVTDLAEVPFPGEVAELPEACISMGSIEESANANRMKILELQQKLSSEKLETTKLAHLTAQETKEGKRLEVEGKKLEKESKMMEAYNNLISQDSSSMSAEEKAE
ncbi:hypothetical protein E2562_026475 [Oryza meyeriana var. granulata]|uniref:Uncharacterized protein n=1 Tax=Oryza meyeriana var. granulata TaxID=110450 RepID=A0A6G1DNN2_9ORYZ|nr:hypothetical protein E2562_026475 [Oryza meyeriana var. granulata]